MQFIPTGLLITWFKRNADQFGVSTFYNASVSLDKASTGNKEKFQKCAEREIGKITIQYSFFETKVFISQSEYSET